MIPTRVAAAVTLAVLAAMFAPASGTPVLPDTAYHAVAGAGLAVAYAAALEPRRPAVVFAGAFLLAVGVLGGAELVQPFVGRTAAVGDLAADAAGAAVGLAAYRVRHS